MYKYEDHRPYIFTDEGQRHFLAMRDGIQKMIEHSGGG